MVNREREILSERKVDEEYGLTIPYLRRARRERRGPRFLKLGRMVRYRRADIEAYLSAHAVETRDPGTTPARRQNSTRALRVNSLEKTPARYQAPAREPVHELVDD